MADRIRVTSVILASIPREERLVSLSAGRRLARSGVIDSEARNTRSLGRVHGRTDLEPRSGWSWEDSSAGSSSGRWAGNEPGAQTGCSDAARPVRGLLGAAT